MRFEINYGWRADCVWFGKLHRTKFDSFTIFLFLSVKNANIIIDEMKAFENSSIILKSNKFANYEFASGPIVKLQSKKFLIN